MTLPFVLAEAALDDLAEAEDWYCGCLPGLELDFRLCFEETLDRITRQPLAYPCIDGAFRRAMIHRFPFGVIYRMTEAQVIIVSVFHSKRDPRVWQARSD